MRRTLGLLLATALVVLVPSAAHAEGSSYKDTGGDVWAHRSGGSVLESGHTDGDVQYVSVRHRAHRVRVLLTVSSIDADGGSSYRPTLFRFALVNGRGKVKVFDLDADNRLRVRSYANGHYGVARCHGAHHTVNTASARVALTVPRSCLGRPRLVRLQATAFDWDKNGVGFVDDAYTAYDSTSPSVKPGSSPWLERG